MLDLGNVLLRWDPLPAIAAGVGEEEARAFLASDDVCFGAWNHAQDAGRSWAEALAWLAEHHPRWLEHGKAYVEHFPESLPGLVPGSADVLRELVAQQVPTYALTNWSAELWPVATARFAELGLFRDVVVSGEAGVAKPDPAIFDLTAERIGAAPREVFFTDDGPRNVAAARDAGWEAEQFTDAATLRAQLVERDLLRPSRQSRQG